MKNAVAVVLLLGTLACAGHDAEPATADAEASAPGSAAEDSAAAVPIRPLHLARLEEPAPSTFPHDPHLGFDCARCHTRVAGHERHANVPCRQCHEAPEPAVTGASAPDCQSCHHADNGAFGCLHCHDRPTSAPAERRIDVPVWVAGRAAPATRSLPFEHPRHQAFECTRCHEQSATRSTIAACTSCHARHHRADADCRSCHALVPAQAHPSARVHQGCAGGGCHTDATVVALPFSRSLCLVCHAAQAAHEPGGDCAACHKLGAAGAPLKGARP